MNNNVICLHKSCRNGGACAYKKKLATIVSMFGKDWANDYTLARQFRPIYPVAFGCERYKDNNNERNSNNKQA